VQEGNPFGGPFRPRPAREAFSRRANHQFTLVVLIIEEIIGRGRLKGSLSYM